ncbi:pyrrolo-quinoline quinone [Verrucomicrobiaceae bacterium SCGC AG-212-N21]|nr:pyrrolo-quinoline quinone [Verrucomicrobiaceae bacterium SCGC AG-212-N21]
MNSFASFPVLLCGISAFCFPISAFSSDWSQFRGPNSSGYSADAQVPLKPKIDWTAELPGRGLASPIIVGDKVFVTCSSGPKQERLHVISFNAKDGSKLWERQLKATGRTMSHPKTSVAACTPCSDGKRVFALWSSNDLAAFDLEGNLLWLRGLTVDYANASNSLGMASSPVVIGETVVTMIENDSESYTLGIDANTGRNLWKMERPKSANWSSPLVWQADKDSAPVVVLQSSKGLVAVDPATGSRLWEYTDGASTTSSGVVVGDVVYAASKGITALKPSKTGGEPEQLWRSEQMNPNTVSLVATGAKIYALNGAVLSQADLKTGERGWKIRVADAKTSGGFSGSPVASGDHVVAVTEKGLLLVVDTTGKEGSVVGSLQLPLKADTKELVLCTPALSGKAIFLRTDSALWRVGAE